MARTPLLTLLVAMLLLAAAGADAARALQQSRSNGGRTGVNQQMSAQLAQQQIRAATRNPNPNVRAGMTHQATRTAGAATQLAAGNTWGAVNAWQRPPNAMGVGR